MWFLLSILNVEKILKSSNPKNENSFQESLLWTYSKTHPIKAGSCCADIPIKNLKYYYKCMKRTTIPTAICFPQQKLIEFALFLFDFIFENCSVDEIKYLIDWE